MKRKDILKKLRQAGRTFEEGSNHTKVYKDGVFQATVGRHNEINERIVERIESQTGVKLH